MEITKGTAELIGVIIGDGHIYRKNRKYQIGITGSPITDKEYFEILKDLIFREWKKEVKIKFRERGLRIVFDSKKICNFLINDLNFPHGKGKGERVEIPKIIFDDLNLVKHTIRGITDTDGSVFVSRKPGIEKYPCIEITTTSKNLANQLKLVLTEIGFRVTLRSHKPKIPSSLIVYRIALNGKKNLEKWIKEIGFSNSYKQDRALDYLKI